MMEFGFNSKVASDAFDEWSGTSDEMVSNDTRKLLEGVRMIGHGVTNSKTFASTSQSAMTVDEILFQSRAAAKIYASKVAMRMDPVWRDKLFGQLDSLLDPEEWDELDNPLVTESFATFIKVMFLLLPGRRPGLGLTFQGNIIAVWSNGENRLTIECLPNDIARWVLAYQVETGIERTAGEAKISRLVDHLSPFELERWFARPLSEPA